MKLLFVHGHKFIKLDEKHYTTGQLPYELFEKRYLQNFESVTVCARVLEKADIKNLNRSDGENVIIKKLQDMSVIKNRRAVMKLNKKILKKEIMQVDAVVARMPSGYSNLAIKIAKKYNKLLVVEVVGDAFEPLWNHGSILGKIIAPISAIKHRKSIKSSNYTIYVTEEQLQKKYPSAKDAYTINASNVELEKTEKKILYKKIEKEKIRPSDNIKIGLIGSFATKYKGIHSAIDLIASLRIKGIMAELHVLGNGDNEWLIKRAQNLGVSKSIYFYGMLPTGKPVLEWLDRFDLYIQPSLTEGLPRALIEAMSRGLPAIGSNVGGIPELLDTRFTHEPNESKDLVQKVLNLINDKDEMITQAENNFNKAQKYSVEVLRKRRDVFWKNIINKELL